MTTTNPSSLVEGTYTTYDDTDLMSDRNGELQDLTNRLVDRATAHGMEDSTEKSKTMTNRTNISADMTMNGRK